MPKQGTALLVHVTLELRGQLPTPEEVTALLGVEPHKTWREGDINVRSPIGSRRLEDACLYVAKVEQPDVEPDPGEVVATLLNLFPDLSAFSKLGPSVRKSCVLGVSGYQTRPYASLSASVLSGLALAEMSG